MILAFKIIIKRMTYRMISRISFKMIFRMTLKTRDFNGYRWTNLEGFLTRNTSRGGGLKGLEGVIV